MTKTTTFRYFCSLFSPYRPLFALFLSLFFITSGIGFLSSLLGVRLEKIEDNETIIGLTMSLYFLGLLIGANVLVKLLQKIGHIRLFAFVAAGGASVAVIHGIIPNAILWGGFRLISGMCSAGFYLVAESWISTISLSTNRARLLSSYNFITLMGFGCGQFFLPLEKREALPFSIIALCYCLGILPIALTHLKEPSMEVVSRLKIREVWQSSPMAVTDSFIGGAADSIFWALGPLIALHFGFSLKEIALFMASASIGGAFLQWPIGRLSDIYERRKVLTSVSFFCALTVFLMIIFVTFPLFNSLFPIIGALFGGLKYSMYPIGIALLNDHISQEQRIEATRTLLILASIGAFLGPFIGGLVMNISGPYGTLATLSLLLLIPVFQYFYMSRHQLFTRKRFSTPFKSNGRSLIIPNDENMKNPSES